MIRVVLPYHLRNLAKVGAEVQVEVDGPATIPAVVAALEARWPVLKGTIFDPATGRRRAFLRFFACKEDLSHEPADAVVPAAVVAGEEPLLVVASMAGG